MLSVLRALRGRSRTAVYARVYTRHGTTLSGYLRAVRSDALILSNATVFFEGQTGGERPLQGEIRILKENIDFYVLL
jgi:hypothetical protein